MVASADRTAAAPTAAAGLRDSDCAPRASRRPTVARGPTAAPPRRKPIMTQGRPGRSTQDRGERPGPELRAHLLRAGRALPRIGVAGTFFGESQLMRAEFP